MPLWTMEFKKTFNDHTQERKTIKMRNKKCNRQDSVLECSTKPKAAAAGDYSVLDYPKAAAAGDYSMLDHSVQPKSAAAYMPIFPTLTTVHLLYR